MSLRKVILAAALLVATAGAARAQEVLAGADFDTRFDNREYANNDFNESQTLFSARLTPYVGIEWERKNRLVFGVEMLQHFGQYNAEGDRFLTDIKPLMYYQFRTAAVQANAGIFNRRELMGDYSRAFFSDSTAFYHNRMAGFLGRYVSWRDKTYIELAIDWEGMYSEQSREMFRILSAGRYTTLPGFYVGYAFSMFHFAGSKLNENVTDNLLLNPYVGWELGERLGLDIRAGALFAPQRARSVDHEWKKPWGGQLDVVLTTWWGLKVENNLYLGENLQPLRNLVANPTLGLTYGADGLYAGESFYATTEHIYNRTWVGFDRRFFHDTVQVEAGMVFHYDGTGLGTQQVVQLSVAIDKVFHRGGPRHRHGIR